MRLALFAVALGALLAVLLGRVAGKDGGGYVGCIAPPRHRGLPLLPITPELDEPW